MKASAIFSLILLLKVVSAAWKGKIGGLILPTLGGGGVSAILASFGTDWWKERKFKQKLLNGFNHNSIDKFEEWGQTNLIKSSILKSYYILTGQQGVGKSFAMKQAEILLEIKELFMLISQQLRLGSQIRSERKQ